MFNSIFRKQFFLYTVTLIVSFALISLGLVFLFRTYFVQRTTETMEAQGPRLAESYVRYMSQGTPGGQMQALTQFQNDVKMLGTLGASCIFVDTAGKVVACTSDITSLAVNDIIDAPDMAGVFEGYTVTIQGRLGGVFTEDVLTVGYPIVVQSAFGGRVQVGALFMNASMAEVHQTTYDVIRLTVLCLFAALAMSFVMVFITTQTLSRSIRQISDAAKVVADGEFDKRLAVRGHDEVSRLAESFNEMAASLENQEKNRRGFIANISHDLRSPLTSMRGFLTAIMDGTIPPEGRDKYLQIVLDESERLTKLANDILDINKIQNMDVELDMTSFDVNELIRRTLFTFEPRITSNRIQLEVAFADERNLVFADEDKIRRVIYNLVDNAIKFTDENGCIQVETSAKGGKVTVCVKDNGRGISEEDRRHVFDRFYKADASRGEDKKGSGLGLSIVRAFIKAHGESITLDSQPGQGCAFTFTLTEG